MSETEAIEPISPLIESIQRLDPLAAASELGTQPPAIIRDILSALPEEKAFTIAAHLPGCVTREEADSAALFDGIRGTIQEFVEPAKGALPDNRTVAGALDHMVQSGSEVHFTYLYIVDVMQRLIGIVGMRDLLLAKPGQRLHEIMTGEPFAFQTDTPLPEALRAALKSHHRVYPVVDDQGVLQGIVPSWRLFERVASDLSAQPGSMVGVNKEERLTTGLFEAFRMRHPWLQLNLITAFAAAFVVGVFEDTIAQIVALAVFLPVLAGQSGNTGCQALAITLRGLTLGELGDYPVNKLLRKEVMLGAMNGFFVGLIAALAMWIYAAATGTENAPMLALTILIAMVGACVGSGIFGVLVPITLRRFGADPATASSIFLTTFTDIIGMGLMLLLATSLVL